MLSIPRDLVVHMNLQSNSEQHLDQQDQRRLRGPVHEHHLLRRQAVHGPQRRRLRGGARGRQGHGPHLRPLHRHRLRRVSRHGQHLGGVDVCLSTNLDDNSYPTTSNGYHPIHFKAGCQHLNGEQALEVARSRHAIEPQQSSDFGRAQAAAGHHAGDQEEGDDGQRLRQGAAAARARCRRTSTPT